AALLAEAQVAQSAAAQPAAGAAAAPAAVETEPCTQCHRPFPKDELMRFENDRICAECKPVYLQRLKEGVRPSMAFVYAGFWIRVAAKILDGLILSVPYIVVIFLILPRLVAAQRAGNTGLAASCLLQLAVYGLSVAYETWFVGRFGATPGKMAVKI